MKSCFLVYIGTSLISLFTQSMLVDFVVLQYCRMNINILDTNRLYKLCIHRAIVVDIHPLTKRKMLQLRIVRTFDLLHEFMGK